MALIDFKKVAEETNAGSFVMTGRDAIKTDLIIGAYPNGITVIGADLIKASKKIDGIETQYTYGVVNFAEDESKYINAGKALTDIITEWAASYDGNTEIMSLDLKESGGVKMKFIKKSTKSGNTFTEVIIL